MKGIDLPPKELEVIKLILKQYVPSCEVRAFGSRVTHTAKKFSDLDIVIMSTTPIPLNLLADMKEAFSVSSLPIRVDLVDWSRISPDFQKIIEKNYIVVQK